MKRISVFLLVGCMLFGVAGCATKPKGDVEGTVPPKITGDTTSDATQTGDIEPGESQEVDLQYEKLGIAEDEVGLQYLVVKAINNAGGIVPSVNAQCLFKNSGKLVSESSTETEMVGEAILAFRLPLNEDRSLAEYDDYEVRLSEGEDFFHKDVKGNLSAEVSRESSGNFLISLNGKAGTYNLTILCYFGGELVGISEHQNFALDGERVETVSAPCVEFDNYQLFINYALE